MLIGKNITLRPLKMEDLEETHKWRNNLELIRVTQGIRFPKSLELDKAWFEHALSDMSNRNIYFGIDENETEEYVGMIQMNNIDYISGTATWGFIIGDSSKHGKGYSTEAPKLMFDYAFSVLNLRKIFGYALDNNVASKKMHKKIGSVSDEGLLKKHVYFNDEYHDVRVLSIFREDYQKNN